MYLLIIISEYLNIEKILCQFERFTEHGIGTVYWRNEALSNKHADIYKLHSFFFPANLRDVFACSSQCRVELKSCMRLIMENIKVILLDRSETQRHEGRESENSYDSNNKILVFISPLGDSFPSQKTPRNKAKTIPTTAFPNSV